jgi:hypothetical protein
MTQLWKNNVSDPQYGWWIFPPKNAKCRTLSPGNSYLSTDGTHYYLNNECNLTTLTK